ncbi:hypothetical protein [Marinomonas posidonica]|uniref:Flagellar basal-body/hook protein C-terminal domain-containing protein n=1 Tax=Marinomonas posidonica (strain CECT 7376 / NCIMB 14433 / IVIA-Po-181) TaxID=491952 RepID=F6CTD0_MARPP|nr:hypothetical protein [Marinomonas posidonica]AEF53979.1 hypothetical protein Mar181_0930 [Marinomonas posidonica IVIA-Po-181]
MKIQNPPFLYGQQGLQQSQRNLEQASQEVAHIATQTFDRVQPKELDVQHGTIEEGLMEARQATQNAQSNAKVIDGSNKTIGSLIDITV